MEYYDGPDGEKLTLSAEEESESGRGERIIRWGVRLASLLFVLAVVVWLLGGVPSFLPTVIFCALLGLLALSGSGANREEGDES